MKRLRLLATTILLGTALTAFAQTPSTVTPVSGQRGDSPIFKLTVNVVERTTKAINYRHRGGATAVDFRGTPLLPNAKGKAEVESKQGYIGIEVEFDDLQ